MGWVSTCIQVRGRGRTLPAVKVASSSHATRGGGGSRDQLHRDSAEARSFISTLTARMATNLQAAQFVSRMPPAACLHVMVMSCYAHVGCRDVLTGVCSLVSSPPLTCLFPFQLYPATPGVRIHGRRLEGEDEEEGQRSGGYF